MYFISRYELGKTLASKVQHLRGSEPIIVNLKDSWLLTAISVASKVRGWVYPLLTEQLVIPGDDRIIGLINQDGELCYNPSLSKFEIEDLEINNQSTIQEASREAFGRLNRRISEYGFVKVAARRYDESQAALQRSLEAQPPKEVECQVRVNLVHAISGHAMQLIAEKKYDDAIVLYDTAKSVIDSRDCGMKTSNGSSPSDETKEADKQLQKQRDDITSKQNDAKRQRNGDSTDKNNNSSQGDNNKDDAKDSSTPSQDQIDKLEKQQQQNATKEQQRRGAARGYENRDQSSYSSRDYKQKTW